MTKLSVNIERARDAIARALEIESTWRGC
jgi:hypothetical protein